MPRKRRPLNADGHGAPDDEHEQRHLQRKARHQHPVRHVEQPRVLHHVDVRRRDEERQHEQSPARHAPRRPPQQPGGAEQFEQAGDQHHLLRPGHPRRHDAHLGGGEGEMRHAADGEPDEDDAHAEEPGDFLAAEGRLAGLPARPRIRRPGPLRAAGRRAEFATVAPGRRHVGRAARRRLPPECPASRRPRQARPTGTTAPGRLSGDAGDGALPPGSAGPETSAGAGACGSRPGGTGSGRLSGKATRERRLPPSDDPERRESPPDDPERRGCRLPGAWGRGWRRTGGVPVARSVRLRGRRRLLFHAFHEREGRGPPADGSVRCLRGPPRTGASL